MTEQQFNTKLAAAVRNARKEKGISQEDLAELLGINRVSIVNIEKCRCSTTIFKVAILLSVLKIQLPDVGEGFTAKLSKLRNASTVIKAQKRKKAIAEQIKRLKAREKELDNQIRPL